ncbi:MAG: DUF5686 and carboxypeptidase regulatory-like domain-containing protein [Putridiphycobacter sp.]|nr:DUF5686 and carboxypeptidase regulatory-like domain-containing protein [Putridiphycobacter sp.]
MKLFLTFLFSIVLAHIMFGQTISGFVFDERNNPIPFAQVNVKNFENLGARTNIEGFYEFFIEQGQYELIFSSVGFESVTIKVVVNPNAAVVQNMYLKESITELTEVEVSTKRTNVGYEIVKNVIANRENLLEPFTGFTCQMYVKERETFDVKIKEKEAEEDEIEAGNQPKDVFEEEDKKNQAKIEQGGRLNLMERQITVNFQYPNKIKEEVTAQDKIGNSQQLYLKRAPVYPKVRFDFYSGLMRQEFLHETPIVSPLHASGILSYKYKLTEIITHRQDTIYKVKVSSRSVGSSSMEGFLYIKKHDWALTKVDLTISKGNLKLYDEFRIEQEYTQFDSIWLVTKQRFEYKTKYFKETVYGVTEITYSDFKLNPEFPKKFFGAEVAITTKEAAERDSTYWEKLRPAPLTVEEQRKKFVQDSLTAIYTSKAYLDSVDSEFNKITLLKVVALGIDHRNREKKTQWYFTSLIDFIEPVGVAAPRAGPYARYFKKFDNEQWLQTWVNSSIGLLNGDVRGNVGVYHLYNPKKLATYYARYSHGLGSLNWAAQYFDQLKLSNYFNVDNYQVSHNFEIVNGLKLYTEFSAQKRYPLGDLKLLNIRWVDSLVDKGEPYQFEPYVSTRSIIALSFTPFQKYVSEPYRKVVLGSRWPTFTVRHEKGIKGLFGSNVDFDYLSLSIKQEFSIGTIGKTNYYFTTGQFINKKSIELIDKKFFVRSDTSTLFRFLMNSPTGQFQNLQEQYVTENLYAEFHIIHRFNGAIVNKIPFMKKTRIRSLAGAGFLYLPEVNNLFYQEAYVGIERNFKFLRTIIRPALYLVYSDSNVQQPNLRVKFGITTLNMRDMQFNF